MRYNLKFFYLPYELKSHIWPPKPSLLATLLSASAMFLYLSSPDPGSPAPFRPHYRATSPIPHFTYLLSPIHGIFRANFVAGITAVSDKYSLFGHK